MIEEIIKIIILLLPAAFANMSPVLFSKINFLNLPVDFNKRINGKPILGKNKTFRGFFFGIIVSIILSYLLSLAYNNYSSFYLIDYNTHHFALIGFLLGFGALFGDIVKSFFKRRIDIKPGKSWIPFDQIDWIIGALLFISIIQFIEIKYWIISLILLGILHPIGNYIGFLLKLKKNKF